MSAPPFKVKALFHYSSSHDDDLQFPEAQIITVTEEEGDDWYVGEYTSGDGVKHEGLFPKNFVERFEPTAPPRPTRTSRPKKDDPVPAPVPVPVPEPTVVDEPTTAAPEAQDTSVPAPPHQLKTDVEEPVDPVERIVEPEPEPEPEPAPRKLPMQSKPMMPASAPALPPSHAPIEHATSSSRPPPSVQSKPPPPPPAPAGQPEGTDKPVGSFRDRIAAFNKASAAPIAPYKQPNLGNNNFIKKPFVAPPPSKNAYVPVHREPPPQKIYRREEDPEIAATEQANQDIAEKSGLAPTGEEVEQEDQPKVSLKERIALLQKQQMEQAQRHAEAIQKKEKKRPPPPKKRTDSHGPPEIVAEEGADLTRMDSQETAGKKSIDSSRDDALPTRAPPPRRKSSKGPPAQYPESLGDGNEADMSGAGDTTEEPEDMSAGGEMLEELPRKHSIPEPVEESAEVEKAGEEEEEAEEEETDEDVDPETRRKEELRARMAKMSGGMGMHGMFGPPGGMPMMPSAPPKKKKASESSAKSAEPEEAAVPIPIMALPGMMQARSPESISKPFEPAPEEPESPTYDLKEVEEPTPILSRQSTQPHPPPALTPSAGSESDDELSSHAVSRMSTIETVQAGHPAARAPPPPPPEMPPVPTSPVEPVETSPRSPTSTSKRFSRPPPPIPTMSGPPPIPTQSRPPPPPPPGGLSRTSTGDELVHPPPPASNLEESEGEVTEYEGDYDTDIASAVPHKDALKSHARESSLEDAASPIFPTAAPPPIPGTAPRGVPPLPPQAPPQAPRGSVEMPRAPPPLPRNSVDMPRAAPPPPPPPKHMEYEEEEEEEDYPPPPPRHAPTIPPPVLSPPIPQQEESSYTSRPTATRMPSIPPQERPPPLPRDAPPSMPSRGPPRMSMDVQRPRRSVDMSRMSMDTGYMAVEVDLATSSMWWNQPNALPPVFQNRRDILSESEESTSTNGGTRVTVTKEVYVLFSDYSQTIITAQYDPHNASDVSLAQRHEAPPSRLRQDQLEEAHDRFGRSIASAVASKKDTVVGDGTPYGLVRELLKPLHDPLPPIGARAYGALVYSNLANASTQQNDEIRPGDVISFRNARFQGKHGPMHAKYSADVGRPEHVAVVSEWDGTKKKVRAWEQGRENRKVKLESFKLDDLRSGEVKIWRVMPRSWVGWQRN